jgi:hypothetical protein
MAKPRNVQREILLSLGAAVVLGGGFAAYMIDAVSPPEEARARPSTSAPPPAPSRPTSDELAVASELFGRFVAHLAARRHDDAYALMALPYRSMVPAAEFRLACERSAFLASAQRGVLQSTRRLVAPGGPKGPYTTQAQGMLVSSAGSIDANVTLLVERGEPSILVLSLAGVPVLDGVSPHQR